MAEPITFRDAVLEEGWLKIKIPRELLGVVMAWIRRKKDKVYELTIKEYRRKRSLDANAKAWVLMGQLSAAMRVPPEEIYRGYIPDVGGNYEIIPVREDRVSAWDRIWCAGHHGRLTVDMGECRNLKGYHNIKTFYGSSDYDTAQMSRLLDLIMADCRQLGIETLSEREKSLLIEDWGRKDA